MSICLNKDELQELTGRQRPSAQTRALNMMGIDHKIRPDGTVAVYRSTLEDNEKKSSKSGPDFGALTGVA